MNWPCAGSGALLSAPLGGVGGPLQLKSICQQPLLGTVPRAAGSVRHRCSGTRRFPGRNEISPLRECASATPLSDLKVLLSTQSLLTTLHNFPAASWYICESVMLHAFSLDSFCLFLRSIETYPLKFTHTFSWSMCAHFISREGFESLV